MDIGLIIMVVVAGIGLLILLLSGQHIAFALMSMGIFGIYTFLPRSILGDASRQSWDILNTSALTAIVLYVFMGELILKGGLSQKIYEALDKWMGKLPGGLLHSCIGFSAIFAAVSGSSIATTATVGTVSVTSMKERGYEPSLIYGAVAGGSTLGILIPPSVIMILYGALADVSIARCFFGGMIPGIMLALLFMLYIAVRAILTPSLAPTIKSETLIPWKDRLVALIDLMPMFLLAAIVLGGIYLGLYTPTEAAAIGCIVVLVFLLITNRLSWSLLKEALTAALYTSCMIYMILAGAAIMAYVIQYIRIPHLLIEWVIDLDLSPYLVLAFTCMLYYLMGCFICGTTMTIITIPIIFPVMMALGFDPVWYAVVYTINVEVSLISPPVGMNLFVLKGVDPSARFDQIYWGIVPYVGILTLMIILLVLFPQIALFLPNMMVGPH